MKNIDYSIWVTCKDNKISSIKDYFKALLKQTNKNVEVLFYYTPKNKTFLFLNEFIKKNKNLKLFYKIEDLLKNSKGDYIISKISPNFILFKSSLKNVLNHHQKIDKGRKKNIYRYGSKINGFIITPKEKYLDYFKKNLRKSIDDPFNLITDKNILNKTKFYFNFPLGKRVTINPEKISNEFSHINDKKIDEYYIKDKDEFKVKKSILTNEFKIPLKMINRSLIYFLFKEKFDIHFYTNLVEGNKKVKISTIINYPNFYNICSFKKIFNSIHGCLLDLIHFEKPECIDYQFNMIKASRIVCKNLRGISKSKIATLFSSKIDSTTASLSKGWKMILVYTDKEKEGLHKIWTWILEVQSLFLFMSALKKFYIRFYDQIRWIHSSGISVNNKAFLFVGPSHSGKSTTLFRLCNMIKQAKFLSDDMCGIVESKDNVKVIGIPLPVQLRGSNFFKKEDLGFALNVKKWLVLNKNYRFVNKMENISTFFFLERTKYKNTKILDVNDQRIYELVNNKDTFYELVNNKDTFVKEDYFCLLKSRYPHIKFKHVLLGENIGVLVDYIKNQKNDK